MGFGGRGASVYVDNVFLDNRAPVGLKFIDHWIWLCTETPVEKPSTTLYNCKQGNKTFCHHP